MMGLRCHHMVWNELLQYRNRSYTILVYYGQPFTQDSTSPPHPAVYGSYPPAYIDIHRHPVVYGHAPYGFAPYGFPPNPIPVGVPGNPPTIIPAPTLAPDAQQIAPPLY